MRRKRKMKPFPRVPATLLKDTSGLASLKKLPVEELRAALAGAEDVEAWQLSVVRGLETQAPGDALIEPFIAAAMYTRLARECMGIELVLRDAGKVEQNPPAPPKTNGQGKPKGYL